MMRLPALDALWLDMSSTNAIDRSLTIDLDPGVAGGPLNSDRPSAGQSAAESKPTSNTPAVLHRLADPSAFQVRTRQ